MEVTGGRAGSAPHGRLFQNDVGVGPADAERVDCGEAAARAALPADTIRCDLERAS
jgi:hypothetical protein